MIQTFFNTRNAEHEPASCYPWHRADSKSEKAQVMVKYHAAMLAAGVSPYNCLWPFEYTLDPAKQGNWALTMAAFWDGRSLTLPVPLLEELGKWKGMALMLQHVNSNVYMSATGLRLNGINPDDGKWVEEARKFYMSAAAVLDKVGVRGYVHVDEPPILVRDLAAPDWWEALPLPEQPDHVRRILKVAKAAQGSGLSVGPTLTSCWKHRFWLQLEAAFNWWIFIDGDRAHTEGRAWTAAYEMEIPVGHERWLYYTGTNDKMWQTGNEALLLAALPQRLATVKATGVLMYAGIRLNDETGGTSLFAKPPAGTAFDPKVYPAKKLATLSQIVRGTAPAPVPATLEERIADCELRIARLEARI